VWCGSPRNLTTGGLANKNDDDGKQPTTNAKKLDKRHSELAKQRRAMAFWM